MLCTTCTPRTVLLPCLVLGALAPGLAAPQTVAPVRVELAEGSPGAAGTLAFRFRLSRTLRMARKNATPVTAHLLASPFLQLDLTELAAHPILSVEMAAGGPYHPQGRLNLSHLAGGRWYEAACAWDARAGRLDFYLNGVLQEEIRTQDARRPWTFPSVGKGSIQLGGSFGEGEAFVAISVESVKLYPAFQVEDEIRGMLAGRTVAPLEGEGRTEYRGPLDLAVYDLVPIYQADFARPLNATTEKDLFRDGKRSLSPAGKEWVLEGTGRAWTGENELHLANGKGPGDHVVLWNTRIFPSDFLLEFTMTPRDSNTGLNIVFFAARSTAQSGTGGGIFAPGLPLRDGIFAKYTNGALDCYHTSYWATNPDGAPRRTANLRKNAGFHLLASGDDHIAGRPGPQRVRVLKAGGAIRLETNGELSLGFDDDGTTYGPILRDGLIGLRQMAYTGEASYSGLRVWQVKPKQPKSRIGSRAIAP